jgi:DNA-binding response OmpR family regulator
LSPKEADLLRLLCLHENDLLPRQKALKLIWGDDNYFNGRSMDVFITRIRKYLKKDPQIEIVSLHGKGVRLLVNKSA